MNFIEKYDILELSDEKKYTVAEIYNENNVVYLMLLEVINDEVTENLIYGKVVITDSKKYGIETIDDEKEKERLSIVFKPLFENSIK